MWARVSIKLGRFWAGIVVGSLSLVLASDILNDDQYSNMLLSVRSWVRRHAVRLRWIFVTRLRTFLSRLFESKSRSHFEFADLRTSRLHLRTALTNRSR